ncbi:MAG TPA: zinc ribbon domain-containing protein YjdM [Steroidobacteraceae bacterium]|jgi:protein PhnA|nr:zinc ribbon domain-containing protein YjdM [Steroidobacteraceae bacterium]
MRYRRARPVMRTPAFTNYLPARMRPLPAGNRPRPSFWPPGSRTGTVVRDAHGTVLADGDSVTVIKDLKVKGSSSVAQVGTRVKGIRLVDGDHNIDCRIEGIGAMALKSEFVKKA